MEPGARQPRNRRRPRRGGGARWARRIGGLLGTLAFLAAGVASALMILPDGSGEDAAAVAATPTATATPAPKPKKKKKAKPKGPSKADKAALTAALEEVRTQGYTTLKQGDYDVKATLRVLIARPVGDAAGGYRAFFFTKDGFLGTDAQAPSTRLTLAKSGKVTVTLSYGVFETGDAAGAPSGRKRVRFRYENGAVTPLDTIPLDGARFQRRR
ncbi:MAG TPA: LppP/LprE family lipoprotein [Solirubrobacter sp.]|nr:LppP/LprE family lipoprotein [Solirubrobacter sp.]